MADRTYISWGDVVEGIYKLKVKGRKQLAKRLRFSATDRVVGTWDVAGLPPTNWWVIPAIRKRWREKISGNAEMTYAEYVYERFLKGRKDLRMLSPGCGTGSHEIHFAKLDCFSHIMGFDLSPVCITEAKKKAEPFPHLHYMTANAHQLAYKENSYDFILFHSSLHHFDSLESYVALLKRALKPNGIIVIHEYVGPARFQWSKAQLNRIRQLLSNIPERFRRKWGTNEVKTRAYRPGWLRMYLSDPSEAVESDKIIGLMRDNFQVHQETWLGGDLLHLLFKDIAHHFLDESQVNVVDILDWLFKEEDSFIEMRGQSDFMFGIYGKQ